MATETLSFDILARDLASPSFRNLGRAASDASGNLRGLKDQLNEVANKTARARVELDGDKEASVKLDQLTTQIIRLSGRKVDPEVDLAGYLRTRAQIDRIDLALDRLDHRHVTATVSIRQRIGESILSGLSPEGAGGGGLGPLGIGALIGGGALGAGLIPSLVGAGIGGLASLAAVGGGLFGAGQGKTALAADKANIAKLTAALKGALGDQRQQISKELKASQAQFAKDQNFFAPFGVLQQAISGLERTILAPLRPIMAPLAALFKDFGKSLTGLAPQFTALFRASLPFIKQFLDFLLQSGKILLPAFTQAMNQMVKSGALQLMTQGLVSIVKGLAQFIVALGPGMKASAQIFARLATFIGRTLGGLGAVFTAFAKVITFDVPGAVSKGVHAVIDSFDWWRNAVSGVLGDVIAWFKKLPGRILDALFGLGHSLYAFAHAAFTEFWDAIKNVGASVWDWLTSWVQRLPGWLRHLLGIKSPSSVFYDIGKNMMLGLFQGIKEHAHHARNAATAAVGGAGPTSASAAQAQAYARTRLGAFGWSLAQMAPLVALWNQESGWNRFARNPSSGAYGIPQALPPGKMGAAANPPVSSAAAQINWGLGYIKSVYGSPAGAWAHERAFNWYGSGFHGWFDKPTIIGVGERGRERVDITPVHAARGGKIVLELRSTGSSEFDRFMTNWLQSAVRDTGGGDVQVAFGTSY